MPGALSGAPFTDALPERPESFGVVGSRGHHHRDPAVARRAVAVATDAMELLRPESDLFRLLSSFDHVDVLLAAEDAPALDDRDDAAWDEWTGADEGAGADGAGPDVTGGRAPGAAAFPDEVRDRTAALGHPDLVVHRLGLRLPLAVGAEEDLVAAMSELIGFDPEPGLCCLAPASAGGFSTPDEPYRSEVDRAAQRIARVYGLPLLRYRCLGFSLVPGQR